MISDKERREVAERLRALPIDTYAAINEWEKGGLFIDENLSDEADYSQIHGAVLGCFPAEHMHPIDYKELHERLADLIDRPTCHNASGCDNVFKCSECGAEFEPIAVNGNECGDVFYTPLKPLYCSACGAEVVE